MLCSWSDIGLEIISNKIKMLKIITIKFLSSSILFLPHLFKNFKSCFLAKKLNFLESRSSFYQTDLDSQCAYLNYLSIIAIHNDYIFLYIFMNIKSFYQI